MARAISSAVSPQRIGDLLRRIEPTHGAEAYVIAEPPSSRSSVAALFEDRRGAMTLLLWTAFFMNLLVMYFFVNWLPTLLAMAGYALSRAIQASTAFNIGGIVGGLVLAAMIRRRGAIPVLWITFALTGAAIAGISQLGNAPVLIFPAVFLVGRPRVPQRHRGALRNAGDRPAHVGSSRGAHVLCARSRVRRASRTTVYR